MGPTKLTMLDNSKEVSTVPQMEKFTLLNDDVEVSIPPPISDELHLFNDSMDMPLAPTKESQIMY